MIPFQGRRSEVFAVLPEQSYAKIWGEYTTIKNTSNVNWNDSRNQQFGYNICPCFIKCGEISKHIPCMEHTGVVFRCHGATDGSMSGRWRRIILGDVDGHPWSWHHDISCHKQIGEQTIFYNISYVGWNRFGGEMLRCGPQHRCLIPERRMLSYTASKTIRPKLAGNCQRAPQER